MNQKRVKRRLEPKLCPECRMILDNPKKRFCSQSCAVASLGLTGLIANPGERLTSTDAEIILRASGFEPISIYPGNKGLPWLAQCITCGIQGSPRINTLLKGHRCGNCATIRGREIAFRRSADRARVAMISAGAEPLEQYPGSHNPWRCRCLTCGAIVTPRHHGITGGQGPCILCGQKKGGRKLSAAVAVTNMMGIGLEPLEPYLLSNSKWECRCLTCGTTVSVSYRDTVLGGQGGCKPCGYEKAASKRVFSDEIARKVMTEAGLEPLEPYTLSSTPWKSIHLLCGKIVTPSFNSVHNGQSGCKYCSSGGLDRNAPGVIYLMRNEKFYCLKIGVTSHSSKADRIEVHKQSGFLPLKSWNTADGGLAEDIETQVLQHWRKACGAPVAMLPADMPRGGYSETASLLHVDIDDTCRYIEVLLAELTP